MLAELAENALQIGHLALPLFCSSLVQLSEPLQRLQLPLETLRTSAIARLLTNKQSQACSRSDIVSCRAANARL